MARHKLKPHNGLRKRFKLTASGRPRYKRSFAGHLMSGKSGRRRQRLRRPALLSGAIADNVRRALAAD